MKEVILSEKPLLKLICGDCMEYMKDCDTFDLAVVDPPYKDDFKIVASDNAGKVKRDSNLKTLNNNVPTNEYWNELLRVSKNQIIWGVNYYKRYFGSGRIVWDKENTGVYSDCELAYHSFSDVTRKFKWRWNGMIQQDMKNKEIRIHPTQKPVKLYKWIYKHYAKEKDTILDTHLGSGSNAIAAYDAGLDFVGIEIDAEYFEAAVKRIKRHVAQLKIEL